MAGIVFQCSACSHSIASDDSLCGEITTCPDCGADILVPIPGLEAGASCGDFKLLERLGAGAMGEVWLAEQTSMERKVALKVLFPQLASDKRFVARFLKEGKNSAKLAHSNIVTAFHAGVDRGVYYLAISFVSGETIEAILDSSQVYEEKEALRIIRDIASALEYAWDEFKILHRDIKPANIIINKKGIPMLLDMGISKSLDEDSSLTMTGTVVGTPYYMSPEQAIASEDVDFRSDIYSLGTTLYHMLTGSVPFQAGTAMAIIMRHLHDELPPPRERNSDITENCDILLHCMMTKKREHRPQSWAALIKDITAVMNGKPPITPLIKDAASKNQGQEAKNLAAKKGGLPPKSKSTKKEGGFKVKHLIVAGALLAAVAGTAAIGFLTFNYLNSNGETRTDSSNTKADSNENTDAGYIPPASATAENDSTTATPAQPEEYGPPLPKEVASTTASDSTSSTSSTISQDNADTSAAASNDSADTAESVSADSTPSPMKPTENINASDQETSATSKTAGAASRSPASQDSTSVSSQPADENEKTQTTIVPPSPSSGNTDSGSTKQQTSTKQVSKTTSNDTASNSKQKTESSKPTTPTKIAEASTVGGVQTPVEQKNKPPEVASTETAENSASSGNQNTVEQKKVASKDADPTEKTSSKSTPSNSDTAAKSTTPTPPSTAKDASESASSKKGKAATSGTSPTTPVNGVRNESDGGGNDEDAKNKALEEDFVKFSDNFDLTKNTKLYSGEFWSKASGTEHTWHGKVTYVKGGWWKAEVRVACPNRMLYRGFNAILVTSDKAKAAKLKIGQEITFKGNVYSYKHKWSGLVIIYLKNVKILDGSTTEKP